MHRTTRQPFWRSALIGIKKMQKASHGRDKCYLPSHGFHFQWQFPRIEDGLLWTQCAVVVHCGPANMISAFINHTTLSRDDRVRNWLRTGSCLPSSTETANLDRGRKIPISIQFTTKATWFPKCFPSVHNRHLLQLLPDQSRDSILNARGNVSGIFPCVSQHLAMWDFGQGRVQTWQGNLGALPAIQTNVS